jgi:hypothetical protein
MAMTAVLRRMNRVDITFMGFGAHYAIGRRSTPHTRTMLSKWRLLTWVEAAYRPAPHYDWKIVMPERCA